jgi:hypothetical protein
MGGFAFAKILKVSWKPGALTAARIFALTGARSVQVKVPNTPCFQLETFTFRKIFKVWVRLDLVALMAEKRIFRRRPRQVSVLELEC